MESLMLIHVLKCARNLAFCFILGLSASSYAQEATYSNGLKGIGAFQNVRSDGEHADGYSVRLWSREGKIVGFIDHHRGLMGDPPMGILTDVQYDSSTGDISFKARITDGIHYCREHNGVPSHDLISFQGVLKKDMLVGDIVLTDELHSPAIIKEERLNFSMPRDEAFKLKDYADYDAWWKYWEPVYKFRGARW